MLIVRDQRSYDIHMSLQLTPNSQSPLQDWWEAQAELYVQRVKATSLSRLHIQDQGVLSRLVMKHNRGWMPPCVSISRTHARGHRM